MDTKELALICSKIADDKKATDIRILHVEEVFVIADYFVICNGSNPRHVRSIAEDIKLELKKLGKSTPKIEGVEEGKWILIDTGDIVCHIFLEDVRKFYEIEDLWADAPKVEMAEQVS